MDMSRRSSREISRVVRKAQDAGVFADVFFDAQDPGEAARIEGLAITESTEQGPEVRHLAHRDGDSADHHQPWRPQNCTTFLVAAL